MTEAAKKIRETDEKIIEIAFEYGYDSPDSIHAGWKYLFEVFFPEQGYRHSGKPDFEVYSEGDMYSETAKLAGPVDRREAGNRFSVQRDRKSVV